MKQQHVVITGIGTGIGKTVCSAVVCEALGADFWKPVQAGELDQLDSDFVARMTSQTNVIPAVELLTQPLSPHEAARLDEKVLDESQFELPPFMRNTVIEGAGGVMVPLNEEGLCFLDLFQMWGLPVYVVTKHYLGSINHTLLTINALFHREIEIAGIIVNGNRVDASERMYRNYFPTIPITYIPELAELTPESIRNAAIQWNEQQR